MKTAATFAALLLLCACTATSTPSAQTSEIFKHDGSRQCQNGSISPEDMQNELEGITVHEARKDILRNMAFAAVCGGGTPHINVYRINKQDLPQTQQRGFQIMTPAHKGETPF